MRFRSICSLWRSFLPLPPLSNDLCIPHKGHFLIQTKIYRIQPLQHDNEPLTSKKGWLIKVFQDSNSSKFYLLDLFTNKKLPSQDKSTQKVVNLMNVQAIELFELYTLCDNGFPHVSLGCKVILFSVEGCCMVFALIWGCKRLEVSIGEKKITISKDDGGKTFDDMIRYKGQIYVVDKTGTVFWINALSLKLVQFSPKNFSCEMKQIWMNYDENHKQLVECDGNLYMVHFYIDTRFGYFLKDVFVKVYKLDQEWGKWIDVKYLGDVSFVLGKDSNFALLAQDYHGCERNCIYFYFEDRASCFNLENFESKPANVFWPCPTLFHHVTS
ncbi:unnamed protein product [Trifolium pratense]|uniref:Uncharacterized protein n=1 Tax=Trifolium pratense TaxID=57577 RepID=A0ACB0JI99_TRIPR|nr:unnamed protein product [Trifolium pratense]